jgi:hypothetical protein
MSARKSASRRAAGKPVYRMGRAYAEPVVLKVYRVGPRMQDLRMLMSGNGNERRRG